ncbi:MAG: lipopolysaccharide biosynthesis protein [Candidatus Kapaibacteriota bacterium]
MRAKIQLLASDAAIYGLTTLLTRSMSFLLTPLYTNALANRSEFGVYAYLYSLLAFVNVIYAFGMDTAFLRFFSSKDPHKTEQSFSFSWWMIALIGVVCTNVIMFTADSIAGWIPDLKGHGDVIRAIALIPLFDALTNVPYNLLRMQRRAKMFGILRIANVAINLILNLVLVGYMKMGLNGIIIAGIISSLLAVIGVLPIIFKWLRMKFDSTLSKEMLQFGLPTMPSAFSGMMLQVADRPIMTSIAGSDITGLYQANYRLGIPMMMLVSVFEFAYTPFYLSHHDDEVAPRLFARIFTYFTIIACFVFLVISLFIKHIVEFSIGGVSLIHRSYWEGIGIIPIVLAGYLLNGVSTNVALGLHITKKTVWLPIATGLAALTNIALLFVLVPSFGIYGGAWATFFAYAVSAGILWRISIKVYPLPYEWHRLLGTGIITIMLFALSNMVQFNAIMNGMLLIAFPIILFSTGILNTQEKQFIKRVLGNNS